MIEFTNVYKNYENGTPALKGVSFAVDDGEFVFLIGPSGSGKSTIMKLMTGEIMPSAGAVIINNFDVGLISVRKLPKLRRTLGAIFQDFRLISKKTVYENVAFAMRVIGAGNREIRRRVPEILDIVGLGGSEDYFPWELSGGEQQRVAIARALVNNPSIIIADEPTGNIDPDRSFEIMTLLEEINQLGTTVVVVTHEKLLVDKFAKRVIAIDDGRIVRDSVGAYEEAEEEPEFEQMVITELPENQREEEAAVAEAEPESSEKSEALAGTPDAPAETPEAEAATEGSETEADPVVSAIEAEPESLEPEPIVAAEPPESAEPAEAPITESVAAGEKGEVNIRELISRMLAEALDDEDVKKAADKVLNESETVSEVTESGEVNGDGPVSD